MTIVLLGSMARWSLMDQLAIAEDKDVISSLDVSSMMGNKDTSLGL